MDIWDSLDAAEKTGEEFRDKLSQQNGFRFTKWFDGISRYVKPAVLAIAVASGAAGCASMNQQALGHEHDPYKAMVAEAHDLDSMPRGELRDVIEGRTHTTLFNDLEKTTVPELAEKIAGEPGLAVNLGGEVALKNPFVPGQLIQVSENDDWSANMTIAFSGGYGVVHALQTPFNEVPHALNANYLKGAVSSFHEPSRPSFIVLPDRMHVKWPSMMTSKAESVAFTLFHEAAHPHTTQEMALHLDQGGDKNKIDAHFNTYKIFNENHADTTAAISIFKEYDLTAGNFIRKLEDLKAFHDMTTEESGMHGAPNENFKLGKYRSQKALDVLIEISEREPEFLKSLDFEQIPLLAYDVVRQAGYHHNAAEIILEKRLEGIDAVLAERDLHEEESFIKALERTFPDNEVIAGGVSELRQVQADMITRNAVEAYTSSLAADIMFKDMELPERTLNPAINATKMFPVEGYDVPALIESHIEEILKRTEPEQFFEHLEGLKVKMDEVLQVMPDRETIQDSRIEALADIRQELIDLNLEAKAADKSSVVANGSGGDAASIADDVMQKYGIDTAEVTDRNTVAAKQSAPSF
jgi:hypothetical protein